MTGNLTLPGQHTFSISQEMCINDKHIYELTVYNDSDSTDLDDAGMASRNASVVYYLHFQPYASSVVGESADVAQWVLSKNEISDDFLAVCARDDIFDCTKGSWEVMVMHSAQSSVSIQKVDEGMQVRRGSCGDAGDDSEDQFHGER